MTDFKEINFSFLDVMEKNRDARTFVFYGGAGSGKSVFVMQYLSKEALERPINILILRKWGEVVRESVIVPYSAMIRAWGYPWDEKFHKTERRLILGESRVVFGGLDNVEKYKGTNWDYIWIEEATDITADDFNQLNLRLGRDSENAKVILTFNPVDANHWIVQRFVKTTQPKTIVHHSTYLDNYKFLSSAFVSELENLINVDENFYRVYALGEPGVLQNLIYSNWTVAPLPENQYEWQCAGLDFGFNNPTALVYVCQKVDFFYVEERLYESHLTNADLIDWLKQNHESRIPIYADSAEPQRIEEIRRAGFSVIPADKSVKDGIDYVQAQRLMISPVSQNLIKEIRGYKWKEKNGVVFDEPVKVHDHVLDSLRYALKTHYGQGTGVIIPKEWVGFGGTGMNTDFEEDWA